MLRRRSTIAATFASLAALLASPSALAATWAGPGPTGHAAHATLVSVDAHKAVIDIEVPGAWIDGVTHGGTQYGDVSLPEGMVHGRIGAPGLPEAGLLVALPEGRATQLKVLSVETETIGKLPPLPVQPESCRCGPQLPKRFVVDPASYSGSVMLPDAPAADLATPGFLRDVRLTRINLRPVAWNPASGTLELRKRVRVQIDFGAADPSAMPRRSLLGLPRSFGPATDRIAIDLRQGNRAGIPGPDHMVVIAPAAWLSHAQPLVDWRIRTGTRVTVQSMESIGTKSSQLQAWLQNAYDTWQQPPTIVLLVGDENAVPPGFGQTANATSDFVYTKLAGNDIYPDIIIGRLPARTEADVDTQIGKTLAYETTPDTGAAAAWYRGAITISSSEGSGQSNDDVRTDQINDLLTGWGFTPVPKYYASKNSATPSKINQSLNTGSSWISYMGHGDEVSWASTEPAYVASDEMPALTNGNKLPVIWDVACLNGAFDQSSPCFAETWMNAAGKGAVAIWASTVLASWDEPAIWAVEATRAFTHDGVFRYGETNVAGMLALIASGGTGSNIEEEFEKYVLFGDPLLEIRSREPSELTVDHLPSGNELGGPFPVTVSTGGAPLGNARVAVTSEGQVLDVALTDSTGVATLDLPPVSQQTFQLTVTARDAVPVLRDVPLQPPECGFLSLSAKDLTACDQSIDIMLADIDLDTNAAAADTATLPVTVDGNAAGTVTLTETGLNTHIFKGVLKVAKTAAPGVVVLAHGQKLVVRYDDAACKGAPATVTRELTAQCEPPQLTDVLVDQIGPTSARVNWATNVSADSTVEYGLNQSLGKSVKASSAVQQHQLMLTGLAYQTTYLFRVGSVDQVGNSAWADNAGAMYTFTTQPCQPACDGKQCGPDGCGSVCGTCADGMACGTNSLCECPTHPQAGCKNCKCEKCVCSLDDWCCTHEWDSQCAKECVEQCGGCEIMQVDGGVEAGPEAGPEPGPEAGPEAGKDASADAEAGAEAGKPEAGVKEAGADAGADADAGVPAVTDEEDAGGGGCGCTTAPRTHSAWGWLALGALVALRRRAR